MLWKAKEFFDAEMSKAPVGGGVAVIFIYNVDNFVGDGEAVYRRLVSYIILGAERSEREGRRLPGGPLGPKFTGPQVTVRTEHPRERREEVFRWLRKGDPLPKVDPADVRKARQAVDRAYDSLRCIHAEEKARLDREFREILADQRKLGRAPVTEVADASVLLRQQEQELAQWEVAQRRRISELREAGNDLDRILKKIREQGILAITLPPVDFSAYPTTEDGFREWAGNVRKMIGRISENRTLTDKQREDQVHHLQKVAGQWDRIAEQMAAAKRRAKEGAAEALDLERLLPVELSKRRKQAEDKVEATRREDAAARKVDEEAMRRLRQRRDRHDRESADLRKLAQEVAIASRILTKLPK